MWKRLGCFLFFLKTAYLYLDFHNQDLGIFFSARERGRFMYYLLCKSTNCCLSTLWAQVMQVCDKLTPSGKWKIIEYVFVQQWNKKIECGQEATHKFGHKHHLFFFTKSSCKLYICMHQQRKRALFINFSQRLPLWRLCSPFKARLPKNEVHVYITIIYTKTI